MVTPEKTNDEYGVRPLVHDMCSDRCRPLTDRLCRLCVARAPPPVILARAWSRSGTLRGGSKGRA
jgi:hypothetical protein